MKILASLVCLCLGLVLTPNLTNQHLKVYNGEWEGSLTYLNYGDDETLVTLPMRVEAEHSEKGVEFKYFFTEPGGRIEKRTDRFRIKKDKIYYNGYWELESTDIKSLDEWTLELVSEGKDNNRKASFRKIVKVSADEITIKKMVRYDGTDDYFMRNSYVFNR
ncbi:hypothetical protein [Roseivirga misakiensis]|uniref:Lipocalin-like domain-containing protein n=1 Tax=Roseivirga misakiensis TaxID=1563681 RepID=A0A1E5SYB7_9BACT|nr:hypothetical protein [Roseivirga misakiensis]OEK04110.1 hypothetical protein BFP71_11525 [Roseivirga misakiensis]